MFPEVSLDLENIILRSAETEDDYHNSFRMVHNAFVQSGYIDPSPSGMRFIPQHFHNDTSVFLGIYQKKNQSIPIYTISVFPDSEEGLPMDRAFKDELDSLREKGRFIVEVGALASDPLYRKKDMNLPFLGNKMAIRYAMDYLKADDIVITIHPKDQWLYENIILFKKIGRVKQYSYVKNNPAVAMRLDLRLMEQNYKEIYGPLPPQNNLHHFFFRASSKSIIMPDIESCDSRKNRVGDLMLN
jgi:hypothetical protein